MNISIILVAVFGSIVSLIGTMLGSLVGIIVKNPSNKFLGGIIGFSGGLMLSIVVFDLIPEALQNWSFIYTILFCIMGIITITIVDNNLSSDKLDKNTRIAFVTALGLMIHNFPEGIIMGCGFAAAGNLGLKMSLIIAIHDIPEGIAVASPLIASKTKASKVVMYTFFTALPTALGALIGVYVGSISENVLGASLSFASGIMLYVVCGEMIPESSKIWNGVLSTIGTLSGIICGLLLAKLI